MQFSIDSFQIYVTPFLTLTIVNDFSNKEKGVCKEGIILEERGVGTNKESQFNPLRPIK